MKKRIKKKINVSYARYLKNKRADRYSGVEEVSYAEKHSARVTYLKKFVLRMVILLTILIIVWPWVNSTSGGDKIIAQNSNNQNNQQQESIPVMLKPEFYGNDNNGQPYSIKADSGVSVSVEKVVLNNISGKMTLQDKSRIDVSSKQGDYMQKEKVLILNGGVILDTDRGYNFNTDSAYVKLNESMATGSDKVKITGVLGDIDANGFVIKNSGDEIFLFGGVDLKAIVDEEEFDKLQKLSEEQSKPSKNENKGGVNEKAE